MKPDPRVTGEKVYISTLGCPKNLVDTEVMAAEIIRSGYTITAEVSEAGLILVNTCSFILPAKEESIEEILGLARYKSPHLGQCRHLIVTGCLPQRYGETLPGLMPEVDLFLGTNEVINIGKHLRNLTALPGRGGVVCGSDRPYLMTSNQERFLLTPGHSAYLKIADGCSNHCSYCAIPKIRGEARSRPVDDLVIEAAKLAARGVKEIILIAQDTTAYGLDLPGRPSLDDLLGELVRLDGPEWIRIMYTYPGRLSSKILETIAREEKICKYLDLPLQHIDGGILSAMNRKGDLEAIRKSISEIREAVPQMALRTSIIVGFPGETREAFLKLVSFVQETRFDHLGGFKYSREEDTQAWSFPGQVSERTKESRLRRLMEIQREISWSINQGLIDSRQTVLIEGISDLEGYGLVGRAARQAPEIDGLTYLKDEPARIGDLVPCRIVGADEYDLFAEKIGEGR